MAAWFPCQHPEQVGIAQFTAIVRQLRTCAALIASMMAVGIAAQAYGSSWWQALVWQGVMATLATIAWTRWSRMRLLPVPRQMPPELLHNTTRYAACCGAAWAVGVAAWAPWHEPQLALIAVAVTMVYGLHVVSTFYFLPAAVVAFSVPLLAAGVYACVRTLDPPVAVAGVALITLHSLAAFRLLRRNWTDFAHAIDVDVERDRLSAMLQEQKEIAEKAVQLKSRFLASASHDLRQPMHAISLYLDGLAEAELPERIRLVIADARVCAHDMIDMFRSLLDISRLDAHQAVPSLVSFGIGGVLSRVEKEFLPLATSRGIRLKVRGCDDHVYSDPVMVERIALNFVSNAVRYTPAGRVLVGCRVRGRSLRLAVYDTGKGIPESDQQAIFDEFRRLDTSRPHDSTGGLGLGLAIVRRLAQALRLQVTVRSTPGRGSMFAVDLPLVHIARGSHEETSAPAGLAGRLVVLVDDEPSILMAAAFILETAGCEVLTARSGQELMLAVANSVRVPDFIICDYELNEKSKGSDLIRRVREEFNSDIPALLVTGNTAGGPAEKAAQELRIPILYKPLEAEALRSSMQGLLTTEEQ